MTFHYTCNNNILAHIDTHAHNSLFFKFPTKGNRAISPYYSLLLYNQSPMRDSSVHFGWRALIFTSSAKESKHEGADARLMDFTPLVSCTTGKGPGGDLVETGGE